MRKFACFVFLFFLIASAWSSDCSKTSVSLIPLTELGRRNYHGKLGGLYPSGQNIPPHLHLEAGLKSAREIKPLDENGNPSSSGKIVLLSIGMSNTAMEFSAFKQMADNDDNKNPNLVIVNGAQGGMTGQIVSHPNFPRGRLYWEQVAEQLRDAGVTAAQVQAAWVKEADGRPSQDSFPVYAEQLESELLRIAQLLKTYFPNIKVAYYSSRIYGGYATTPLNPEPYAYESGFSVKWVIEKQIKGDPELNFDPGRGEVNAPWLAWGPYLWADGTSPRKDGLTWPCQDLGERDGTHPSRSGREKVAKLLLQFFKTEPTSKSWFIGKWTR